MSNGCSIALMACSLRHCKQRWRAGRAVVWRDAKVPSRNSVVVPVAMSQVQVAGDLTVLHAAEGNSEKL